jgi:DNA-binding GntR family transcriptional regulator
MEQQEQDAPAFARVSRESLSDRAYQEIRTALMRSRLKPGERLLLRPLSAQLGLSATPVREALLRLVSEQALVLGERGTVKVPVLDKVSLLEIRDLRVDLEGRAAARAAEIRTDDEIAALERIHGGIVAACDSGRFQTAVELNERFHFALCAMGRLPIVYQFVASLWMRCGPILSHLYDNGVMEWDVHPHVRIVDGLRRQDSHAVRQAVMEDIVRGGRELLLFVEGGSRD